MLPDDRATASAPRLGAGRPSCVRIATESAAAGSEREGIVAMTIGMSSESQGEGEDASPREETWEGIGGV